MPSFNDQHARECSRFPNVVRHADQCRVIPETPNLTEMPMSLFAIQPSKRLIEQREPHLPLPHCSCEAQSLAFAAGYGSTALRQHTLQSLRLADQHANQIGALEDLRQRRVRPCARAVAQVVEQGSSPELHGRIEPRSLAA